MGVTGKRERFAQLVAEGHSQTEAYRRAGYSTANMKDSTLWDSASKLAAHPEVSHRIQEIKAAGAERAEITVEKVLREMAKTAFADFDNFITINDEGQPEVDWDAAKESGAVSALVHVKQNKVGDTITQTDFKLGDKRGALQDIAKHLGMFVEKREEVTDSWAKHFKNLPTGIQKQIIDYYRAQEKEKENRAAMSRGSMVA